MKSKLNLISFLFLFWFNSSSAQEGNASIVQDWAEYIGIQDTIIPIPILQDSYNNIVTAGFTVDSSTGADIMVAKYKETSELIWQRTYSSPGNNRDQATALAIDDSNNVYVAGSVFNTATNYDFILLKYDSAGILLWSSTYNGSANNYDIPGAIGVTDSFIYVTGAVNNSGSLLDIVTIKYHSYTGAQLWVNTYDYASLFDVSFAIETGPDDEAIVTGGSQQTVNDWSYVVLTYSSSGVPQDTLREDGTANGFDRVNALKNDGKGNFYLTGTSATEYEGMNIKTVKIDAGDTIAWIAEFNAGAIEEGTGIAIDADGNVYVCGTVMNTDFDYILLKYDSLGNEVNSQFYSSGHDDEATAICIDAFGNIVVTGKSKQDGVSYDYYTIAYNQELEEIWHYSFNGSYNGNDYATGIVADDNGNIYVTGQSQLDNEPAYEQVTIKYRTDYFVFPEDTGAAPTSMLFYPNLGQIIDTEGNDTYEGEGSQIPVFYYTTNQYPKVYFHMDSVSFVMASVDGDTATIDTLERITMNFVDHYMQEAPLQNTIHDTDQVMNYFQGHCQEGITGVFGSEKLVCSNVYDNTDIIFSNNNAGMKFQIIISAGGPNPDEIQLHFTGLQSLEIVNTSDLKINGLLGSFIYERPLVYLLDEEGVRIPLGWLASYNILDSATVSFTFAGKYDPEQTIVIECARQYLPNQVLHLATPEWSNYFGGVANDEGTKITTDEDGNPYFIGFTASIDFPVSPGIGAFITNTGSDIDAYIAKFGTADGVSDHPSAIADKHLWTTYWGGSADDKAFDIVTVGDGLSGRLFVTGVTNSTDFPKFDDAGNYFQTALEGNEDAFIIGIDNQFGGLNQADRWATNFGGSSAETGFTITKDGSDNIYIGGITTSNFFSADICIVPTDHGFPACNTSSSYNNNGIMGGGSDGFIARFNPSGDLQWSTFFGGDAEEAIEDIRFDSNNKLYCTGNTAGGSFPLDPSSAYDQTDFGGGNLDAFIVCFDASLDLEWSSFFGGSGEDKAHAIAIDGNNNVYIAGGTSSSTPACSTCQVPPTVGQFPLCPNGGYFQTPNTLCVQPSSACGEFGGLSGTFDGFLARFTPTHFFDWGTYYGGNDDDIINDLEVDFANNLYVVGTTGSNSPCPIHVDESHGNNLYQNSTDMGADWLQNFLNGPGNLPGNTDIFMAIFEPNLERNYAAYYSNLNVGNLDEIGNGIGVYATIPENSFWYITGSSNTPGFGGFWTETSIGYCCPNSYSQDINAGGTDAVVIRFSWNAHWMIGIEQVEVNEGISIFPNPTNHYVNVQYNLKNVQDISFQLYTITGNCLMTQSYENQYGSITKNIDFSNYANGLYFLQIKTDENIITKKIIKNY